MPRLVTVLLYGLAIIFSGIMMLRYSNWFWVILSLLLMLLSVQLGRYFSGRRR